MPEAKLYEEDFITLNKYKLYLKMIEEHNIKDPGLLRSLMIMWGLEENTIEKIIYRDICDIVNELRKSVVMEYLELEE
jgi:hypothetical protein